MSGTILKFPTPAITPEPDTNSVRTEILHAAINVLSAPRLTEITLCDIANAAGYPLAQVIAIFPDMGSVGDAVLRYLASLAGDYLP